MHSTDQFETDQQAIRLQGAIKTIFDNFSVGTLLNRCGIKKLKGVSPLAVFEAVLMECSIRILFTPIVTFPQGLNGDRRPNP